MHDMFVVIYNNSPKADFDTIHKDNFDVSNILTQDSDLYLLAQENNCKYAHIWTFNSLMIKSKHKHLDLPEHLKTIGPVPVLNTVN